MNIDQMMKMAPANESGKADGEACKKGFSGYLVLLTPQLCVATYLRAEK